MAIELKRSMFRLAIYIQFSRDFHILVRVYVNDLLMTKSFKEKTSEFSKG